MSSCESTQHDDIITYDITTDPFHVNLEEVNDDVIAYDITTSPFLRHSR